MSASQIRHRFNVLVRRQPDVHQLDNGERNNLLYHIPDSGDYGTSRDLAQQNGQQSGHRSSFLSKLAPRSLLTTTWAVLKSSYINILLVFVPVAIIAGVLDLPPGAIFVLNFLAIVPLASLLSFATEELSENVGPHIGGLLNATFGNAVELIVSVIALQQDQFRLVQASILGSVLINILLVLGCCIIAGGIRRSESKYDPTIASIMSALQTLAASALIVPAMLYWTMKRSAEGDTVDILQVSRGTAIILMVLYGFYLYFQLHSHKDLFQDDVGGDDDDDSEFEGDPQGAAHKESHQGGEILGPTGAFTCMVLSIICVGFCSEFLVNSIESVVEETGMTTTFIGLVLLPIVSNAAEHVTAVVVSWKGKMNLALLVDLGSGMQIALFVTPLLVLISWALDKPFSLHFQLFETVVFFVSVLVVNFLIRGGSSNYLEGIMCVGWYLIIALAFFYYPDDQ
ncbi:Putative calcium/proton exchanger, sodium/calcium exchanger membrane region [Septoria linicola]|uniref:Vacuolar calcium ion transporter n=1 Tax=Septoria linicola TaxID=215465 RepID=A0A9Q9EL10_9PEZI|nr:Putative calcium/proton exchanger, sodium/calcium exchanger membrane region [Septoria linicola]